MIEQKWESMVSIMLLVLSSCRFLGQEFGVYEFGIQQHKELASSYLICTANAKISLYLRISYMS